MKPVHQHLLPRCITAWVGIVLCVVLTPPIYATSPPDSGSKPFIVACSIPPEHESHQPVVYAYRKMLEVHNFQLDMRSVPPARSFHLLRHGQADAICLVSKLSLHRFDQQDGFSLNATLGQSKINAWTLNPQVRLSQYMLDNITQLQIGYIKNHTADFFLQRQGFVKGVALKDVPMAAKMMISGRLDAILMIETANYEQTLRYWLEKQQSGSSNPLRSHTITSVDYVPYLHQRHKPLKHSLESALSQIIADNHGPISRSSIKFWLKNSH